MKPSFVGKRFLQVFVGAFVILTSVYLLRGQPLSGAAKDAAIWALVSATIFAGAVVYYHRKNKPCDICREGETDVRDSGFQRKLGSTEAREEEAIH